MDLVVKSFLCKILVILFTYRLRFTTILNRCRNRYEAQMEKDWTYILEDSDAKVLIVATETIYEKVKNYPGKV